MGNKLTSFLADKKYQDGFWGNWGPYTKCSANCDWGTQTRTRECDNPVPASGGQPCKGSSQQKIPCRITRCGKGINIKT